jgi:hypothetical protein
MVMRSTNAEIAQAYNQQSAAAKRLQDDFRARVKADGPNVEQAVAAIMGGMDLYEAARKFGADPAQVHKRTNYAREMGFSLDPSVQSRADWMTERDANRAGEYGQKIDTADPGSAGGRYRLINRPEGQQIYDSVGNAFIGVNMATPEMLQAVGLGERPSTRPADAATLPGQVAAPVVNGAVQNGVQGNPTQAERDLGTRSTLPGGIDRPPPAAPVLQPQSSTPTPTPAPVAAPRMELPRLGQGGAVNAGMSPLELFMASSGLNMGAAPQQQSVAAPRMMQTDGPDRLDMADRAPQVLMREDAPAPVAAPRPGGTTIRALSATSPGGGVEQPTQGPRDEEDDVNRANSVPPATPQQQPPRVELEPVYAGGKLIGYREPGVAASVDPNTGATIPGRAPGPIQRDPDAPIPPAQRAPQTPEEIRQTELENQRIEEELRRLRAQGTPPPQRNPNLPAPLYPEQLDQILAGTELTREQIVRLKALLPGEVLRQGADTAAVWAAIDNAAKTLNLNIDKNKFDQAVQVAQLTGQYGDTATMDRVKTFGFDQYGNPTLDAAKFIHDKELNYANSARADMLAGVTRSNTSGYMDGGEATLEREMQVGDAERANMTTLANRADQLARIALAQGDQQEAIRQFDISHELKNRIETGRLDLDQQAAQRAWQKDPASFLDQAWASRGMQAPTMGGQPQAQGIAAPRMMAEPAPAGTVAAPQFMQQPERAQPQSAVMMPAPTFQPQQAQPQGRGVMAAPQFQTMQQPNTSAVMRPLNFDEIERSGSNLPGLSAAFKGEEQRGYSTAGGVPKLSAQRMNSLNATERSGLDALLSATGNSPDVYKEETARLSRVGEGPQQFRKRQVAAPRLYA